MTAGLHLSPSAMTPVSAATMFYSFAPTVKETISDGLEEFRQSVNDIAEKYTSVRLLPGPNRTSDASVGDSTVGDIDLPRDGDNVTDTRMGSSVVPSVGISPAEKVTPTTFIGRLTFVTMHYWSPAFVMTILTER